MNVFQRRQEDRSPRRMRKGMYLLPSLFTTANLFAGFYAISQATIGTAGEPWYFDNAAKAIGFAVLFDGMDGAIARLTNTASDFGRELDSLADVVTFGVAPAMLAWNWGFRELPLVLSPDLRARILQLGFAFAFIFLAAGAARLARFNITLNPQPTNPGRPGKKYFVGMPIPGGAGCIAAVVHVASGNPIQKWWYCFVWIGVVGALAFLMVCRWRFWSAKSIDLRSRHPFWLILILGGILALIWYFSRYVLFAIALIYMLSGVLSRLFYAVKRRPSTPSTPPQEVTGH